MSLPTHGRVIVDTTAGEIDIELWSKEAPKACRNFIALALEGYYDGVIFHRIVPNFLVQTGDRTGTGAGGESFYGEPFEDETHPRLRFAHRGLVGMANNGAKNSNDSQFFITLDRADELNGKHTLFGRCVGDTLYNVLKIGEAEIGEDDRPVYPPKIKTIRILDNPFDDIVPRITAAEKRAQQRAREQAQKEREEEMRMRGAKKNVKLLSFGTDEGGEEEEEPVVFKKKNIARPDLVEDPMATRMPESLLQPQPKKRKTEEKERSEDAESKTDKSSKKDNTPAADLAKIRAEHAASKASALSARQTEIERMEADIRKLSKRQSGEDSDEERRRKKGKSKSYLEEQLARYEKNRGVYVKGKGSGKKGKRDDEGVLAALNSFRGMLQTSSAGWRDAEEGNSGEGMEMDVDGAEPKEGTGVGEEDAGVEVDDDRGFLNHALHFPKDDGEESRKAERDYEVIDPRQRGARAREEERERKRAERAERGKGGRRR